MISISASAKNRCAVFKTYKYKTMKLHTNKKHLFKNSLFTLFMIVIILVLPLMAISQDPPGPGDTGGGNPDDAGSVPIDGGLSLVIAAGVGYGAKKIREHNKKKREEEALDRVEL